MGLVAYYYNLIDRIKLELNKKICLPACRVEMLEKFCLEVIFETFRPK